MREFDIERENIAQFAANTEEIINQALNQKANELGLACRATLKMTSELRANIIPKFEPSYVVYLKRVGAKKIYKERMLGKRGEYASYMLVGDGSVSEAELRSFSQFMVY